MAKRRHPTGEIDHIDGDRTNNRIENLREVPHSTNMRNMTRRMGSSGVRGVTARTQRDGTTKWIAQGQHNGKSAYLGVHDTKEAAALARKKWEAGRDFGPSHGLPPPS